MKFLPRFPSRTITAKTENYFVVMCKVLTLLWEDMGAISQGGEKVISGNLQLIFLGLGYYLYSR